MDNKTNRKKYGYIEGWVSIAGNSLIFSVKLILGLSINSIAIIADSIHTFSDIVTSVVVIFGFKIASKPPDEKHPFGHGRGEFIATLIIAILLIAVGLDLAKDSFSRILNPPTVKGSFLAIFIILATAVLKEIMAIFSFKLGRLIDSDVLHVDAWHHRSDALTSVVVAIGILATIYGYFRFDAIAGFLVSLVLIVIGIMYVKRASSSLLGEAPKKTLKQKIKALAENIAGVKGVHDILVHDYGEIRSISLHIEVDRNLSLNDAHKIADDVEDKVYQETKSKTVVHVDVISRGKVSE